MNVELLFDHYFKFLSTKTEIYKSDFNPINLDGLEALKGQIPGTWLEIWLNRIEIFVIWRTSQLLFKLHSHISVSWHFCRFSVISEFSFLGIGLKTKTRNSRKIFIFGSIKFKWMWICVSITISTFWALKLKQTNKKNRLNLTNLEGLDSLERQQYGTQLARWLNYFDNNVIWTIFQEFLKLHSHISIYWGFWWISLTSELTLWGIGLKTKTRKSRKISVFRSANFKFMWICFSIIILTFCKLKLK